MQKVVKIVQWQIYQAKVVAKTRDLRTLQEDLCESFSAKLLATDLAIQSVGYRGASIHHLVPPDALSERQIEKANPFLRKAGDFHNSKIDKQSLYKWQANKRDQSLRDLVQGRVPQDWRLSIAQSIWSSRSIKNANCSQISPWNQYLVARQAKDSVGLSGGFLGDTTKAQDLDLAKPLARKRIRGLAKKIHALLALEPEWQAAFCQQQAKDKSQKESIFSQGCRESTVLRGQSTKSSNKKNKSLRGKGLHLEEWNQSKLQDPLRKHTKASHTTCCRPEVMIKEIKKHVQGVDIQLVSMISTSEYLSAIDHRVIMRRLNTFPRMARQIEDWLKSGVLQKRLVDHRQITKQVERGEIDKSIGIPDLWDLPMVSHSLKEEPSTASHLFADSNSMPWLPVKDCLHSCFPQIIWKSSHLAQGTHQIESSKEKKGDRIISGLLSRILVNDLKKVIQECADTLIACQYKQDCVKDQDLLLDKLPGKDRISLLTQQKKDCVEREKRKFLCLGHSDCLTMIYPDRKVLEICQSKGKDYLTSIAYSDKCISHPEDLVDSQGCQPGFMECVPDKAPFSTINSHAKQSFASQALQIEESSRKESCSERRDQKTSKRGSFPDKRRSASRSWDSRGECQRYATPLYATKKTSRIKNNVKTCGGIQDLGFSLSETPFSSIQDCRKGFVFLGFQVIQIARRGWHVCRVTPSRESIRNLLLTIKNQVKQSKSASTSQWTTRLNNLILRWVEYYKHCEYKREYKKISYLIWQKTRESLSRRKRRKNRGRPVT